MANQNYISIPILDELVTFAEMIPFTKMPIARNDNYPDFIILRIQRRWAGDRSLVDHTLEEGSRFSGGLLEQLTNALEHANTEHGRCWALLFHGSGIGFYEYHHTLPANRRLVQWAEAGDPASTVYHVRNNAGAIDRMLRHMAQTAVPPVRY
ncbi:hypothetical protein B7494_g1724 [Chlorociboria aeruginascens]|nr:hypothetical protein B7494_g1724 [Chlorociboria aeruginascens]